MRIIVIYLITNSLIRIEAKDGDSCERRNVERRLRVKAKRYEQDLAALISAKGAEIRQIEPFAVRLESVRL
ncbi:hypothetical protein [Sporosarcina koreensis]|uniref:hypothetical protein n=1 Tax=Sporosarcina koreensis TaxID=334735 RepID=UPI00128F96F6|nr:hypothetical protein [Sporosarcina koreensis]